MPNGAECRTARNAERRGMPNSAKSQTTTKGGAAQRAKTERREAERGTVFRPLSPFGISRCLGFGAVRHLAPFGISRRSAFRAVSCRPRRGDLVSGDRGWPRDSESRSLAATRLGMTAGLRLLAMTAPPLPHRHAEHPDG